MERHDVRLPDAELEVMKALWSLERYPAHTGEIAARLDKSWKAPGTKEGRANGYTPLVEERDYLARESRSFLERVHGGSLSSLVASLYPEVSLTQEDLAALERILEKGGEEP